MLDYKNENWKVYDLGEMTCSIIFIISIILQFINIKILDSITLKLQLINIEKIMVIIGFGLFGTKEVFAKKKKIGYLYYVVMIGAFATLMLINFL